LNPAQPEKETSVRLQGKPKKEPDYPVQVCEVCETEMYGLHCKIVCPNCGYKRDCSDP
jgi:hypothetical protein